MKHSLKDLEAAVGRQLQKLGANAPPELLKMQELVGGLKQATARKDKASAKKLVAAIYLEQLALQEKGYRRRLGALEVAIAKGNATAKAAQVATQEQLRLLAEARAAVTTPGPKTLRAMSAAADRARDAARQVQAQARGSTKDPSLKLFKVLPGTMHTPSGARPKK